MVVRRITYIAGSVAHSVLAGLGAARYFQSVYGWDWLHPLLGAVVAALIAAMVIGLVSVRAKQREDTVIGAIWAIGMALGLLFFSKTPGYIEPMSYLFGNILMISRIDLFIIVSLDVVVILLAVLFYDRFLAVCFDEEFARLRGVPVGLFYLLLICLISLTVVLMVTVVGIVMVIALLTLPAAVAGLYSRVLWKMMIVSSLLCMAFTSFGLGFSYVYDLPTGSNIILVAGSVYILAVMGNLLLKLRTA